MTKFEKVKKALEEKTIDSANYITITTELDCRHKGRKYAIRNVVTSKIQAECYKTLNEVIQAYDLDI
jgi:histone H3/H4